MHRLDWIFRSIALILAVGLIQADCCKDAVAVIASLSGNATVRPSGSRLKKRAASLDWLSEGSTLEVGTRSKAVLILENGHRYELGEGAKATFTANAAPKMSGASRELPPLPPIPKAAPIAAASAPTPGAGAFRGDIVSGLYPRAGTMALPEKLTLRYNVFPGATSYRVVLDDDGGARLLNVTTESAEVVVASGAIQPGAHYSWSVRAMRSGVEIAVGLAEFSTLSSQGAVQRSEFANALSAGSNGPSMLALVADVDLRLGLVAEACEEFSAALKLKPDDPVLRRSLDSARASLAGEAK